jgi:hypothetical protein
VDDHNLARLVAVRVGVFLGGAPVRGPARVPDAVITIERVKAYRFLEIPELALGPAKRQHAILVHHRYTRRIVPAVFELPKPIDYERHNLFISNVSNNSTHIYLFDFYINLLTPERRG